MTTTLDVLSCRILPGRLTADQTAQLLGVQLWDIAVLVSADLLVPLGDPAPGCTRYFCTVEVQKAAASRTWLDRATATIIKHSTAMNARRGGPKRGPENSTKESSKDSESDEN